MANMLTIGPQDVRLTYLAEGAANIVYRIEPANADPTTGAEYGAAEIQSYSDLTPPPTEIDFPACKPTLEGKLVRLRKALPTTVSVAASFQHYAQQIKPLFADTNLVQSTLFYPTPSLLRNYNLDLRNKEMEGTRPQKRQGLYLAEDEAHGCLITDMSWIFDTSVKCLEFKPKWLAQSPSAPVGARRCRTCALGAMKGRNGVDSASFCPLKLVSESKEDAGTSVAQILTPKNQAGELVTEQLQARLTTFLYKNPLLDRLRTLQLENDPVGVLNADVTDIRFLTAMTLRDCTLFLKVPKDVTREIEARLGDLDLKSSIEGKAHYWRDLERRLVNGGWYMATEADGDERENSCLLA
ncbi:Inositol-pentakisphosphate 2-kinase [Puttea exsequens]|nr:Inositol-pentakisphosphate 2-kinase [Puttea exsequens]